jgi:hypothetical protein
MQRLRGRRNGISRRELRARLKRVGLWLLLILGLNVFGWLLASSLIK